MFAGVDVDAGHRRRELIKLSGEQYVSVDLYRCPDKGIDLFKLLHDVLPDGESAGIWACRRLRLGLITGCFVDPAGPSCQLDRNLSLSSLHPR